MPVRVLDWKYKVFYSIHTYKIWEPVPSPCRHFSTGIHFKGIGMLKLGRVHRQTGEKFVDPAAMSRQTREVSNF